MKPLLDVREWTVKLPTQQGWVRPVNEVSGASRRGGVPGTGRGIGQRQGHAVAGAHGIVAGGSAVERRGVAWRGGGSKGRKGDNEGKGKKREPEGARSEFGLTYLFISHSLSVVAQIATRIAVMRRGKVVEAGAADQVLGAPREDYTKDLLASVPAI